MHLTILPGISSPADLKALDLEQLPTLAAEMRHAICTQVQQSGGHLAPNLGVIEQPLTIPITVMTESDSLVPMSDPDCSFGIVPLHSVREKRIL